jgi:hypothetical protein
MTKTIFFTINGKTVFEQVIPDTLQEKPIHPSISMSSRDDAVLLNFGHEPFSFDLDDKL